MSKEVVLLENKLRTVIKNILKEHYSTTKQDFLLENKLRQTIKSILLKEANTGDIKKTPHPYTAINVLEELLKNIIPIFETDYKTLTSNEAQRKSYKEHIVSAINDAIKPEIVNSNVSVEAEPMQEADADIPTDEGEVSVDINDKNAFIDIDGDKKKEDPVKTEKEKFSIKGRDETGRNVAYQSFKKVETQIMDAYQILSDKEDKKIFLKYLLTNLNLYFDRFENELKTGSPAQQSA